MTICTFHLSLIATASLVSFFKVGRELPIRPIRDDLLVKNITCDFLSGVPAERLVFIQERPSLVAPFDLVENKELLQRLQVIFYDQSLNASTGW